LQEKYSFVVAIVSFIIIICGVQPRQSGLGGSGSIAPETGINIWPQ